MNTTITIHRKFAGPPNIGNGGYVSGLVAQNMSGPAEVTLRQPAPLDYPLSLEHTPEHGLVLRNGHVVVEARPTTLALDVPVPPTFKEALALRDTYIGFQAHPFPRCFVCGPHRVKGDGLRIFPALVPGRELYAAAWVPDASLVNDTGMVRPEFLWAALDCPGGIAALRDTPRPILLGQMTATMNGSVQAGENCVVIGWVIAANGRKHLTGTALFSEAGQLVGKAKAVWIEPKETAQINGRHK